MHTNMYIIYIYCTTTLKVGKALKGENSFDTGNSTLVVVEFIFSSNPFPFPLLYFSYLTSLTIM
jgi:hypothetical protein